MKWKDFIGWIACWIGFSFMDFTNGNIKEPIRWLLFLFVAFTLQWFLANFKIERKKNNE